MKLAFFTPFEGLFNSCFSRLLSPLLHSILASQRKSDDICISLYVSNQYGSLFIFSPECPHRMGAEMKGRA